MRKGTRYIIRGYGSTSATGDWERSSLREARAEARQVARDYGDTLNSVYITAYHTDGRAETVGHLRRDELGRWYWADLGY